MKAVIAENKSVNEISNYTRFPIYLVIYRKPTTTCSIPLN